MFFPAAPQLLMSLLANFSILSSGMGLGFPAITYQSLTNQSDPMALTNDQASWFGKFNFIIYVLLLLQKKIFQNDSIAVSD